jgi:hypothetical protein
MERMMDRAKSVAVQVPLESGGRAPNNFPAQRAKSRFALILSLLFQGGLIEKIVSNRAFPA